MFLSAASFWRSTTKTEERGPRLPRAWQMRFSPFNWFSPQFFWETDKHVVFCPFFCDEEQHRTAVYPLWHLSGLPYLTHGESLKASFWINNKIIDRQEDFSAFREPCFSNRRRLTVPKNTLCEISKAASSVHFFIYFFGFLFFSKLSFRVKRGKKKKKKK